VTTTPFEMDTEQGTGSTGVEWPRSPTTTMTTLTRRYGMLRDETSVLGDDVGTGHRAAQLEALELRAQDRARADVISLLGELSAERGLGWSDIARLVGVSVQAVRKWRRQQPVTGANRLAVARLAALLDTLSSETPIEDPAGWLEIPVVQGCWLRRLDLYRLGRADLLLDLAHLRILPERAMTELTPDWRERYRPEHEVYEAEDGNRSVRRRR